MKACIHGAGAIGLAFGARLAQRGHAVSAVARGATLAALRRLGLRLRVDGVGDSVHTVSATADSAQLGPDTVFLTAMNGVPRRFFERMPGELARARLESVGPGGRLSAAIPAKSVLGAVVHLAASTPEPGLSCIHFVNRLILGEPDDSSSARLAIFATELREGGFEVEASQHIQSDIWSKLWGNMTMNPISALTAATCDRIPQFLSRGNG